eukprot:TRINITY_DN9932_c2_g1_i2.p1 TRINITY_DN9932_c2_g1~~TRINITY_DN9932_c2_g1_i2.p1  ORF type:complete len:699 (+),score=141.53 TRINITY_DN9932_c2_g1_i2:156-2252(+)
MSDVDVSGNTGLSSMSAPAPLLSAVGSWLGEQAQSNTKENAGTASQPGARVRDGPPPEEQREAESWLSGAAAIGFPKPGNFKPVYRMPARQSVGLPPPVSPKAAAEHSPKETPQPRFGTIGAQRSKSDVHSLEGLRQHPPWEGPDDEGGLAALAPAGSRLAGWMARTGSHPLSSRRSLQQQSNIYDAFTREAKNLAYDATGVEKERHGWVSERDGGDGAKDAAKEAEEEPPPAAAAAASTGEFILPEGCVAAVPPEEAVVESEDEGPAEESPYDTIVDQPLAVADQQPFATLVVSGSMLLSCHFPSFRRRTVSRTVYVPPAQPSSDGQPSGNCLHLVVFTHFSCPRAYGLRASVLIGGKELDIGIVRPRGHAITRVLRDLPHTAQSLQFYLTKSTPGKEGQPPSSGESLFTDAVCSLLADQELPPWLAAAHAHPPPPRLVGSLGCFRLHSFFEGTSLHDEVITSQYGGSWHRFVEAHRDVLGSVSYSPEQVTEKELECYATPSELRIYPKSASVAHITERDAGLACEFRKHEVSVVNFLTEFLQRVGWTDEHALLNQLRDRRDFLALLTPTAGVLSQHMRRHSDRFLCRPGSATTSAVYGLNRPENRACVRAKAEEKRKRSDSSSVRKDAPAPPTLPYAQEAHVPADQAGLLPIAQPSPVAPPSGSRSPPTAPLSALGDKMHRRGFDKAATHASRSTT